MMLRIGFAKGRGAAEAMQLIEADGVTLPEEFRAGRVTVHHVLRRDVACYVVRGDDLPSLLASGHLDAAVGSSIVFDEHAKDGSTRVAAALEIARCRLSLITRATTELSGRRLCTRYPRAAARLLSAAEGDAWVIRVLHGCVEAGLFLGLGEAIVDIVETGRTLRMLNLREQRVLCAVQHQVRIRADGPDPMPRLRALMPQVLWDAAAARASYVYVRSHQTPVHSGTRARRSR